MKTQHPLPLEQAIPTQKYSFMISISKFQYFCRISTYNCIFWNIFRYYRSRSNNTPFTYRYSWKNNNILPYPYIISYYNWFLLLKSLFTHRNINTTIFMISRAKKAFWPHHNIISYSYTWHNFTLFSNS